MFWAIVLFVAAVFVVWAASTGKSHPSPTIPMLDREGWRYEDEWYTYVAGVAHYVTKFDEGGFAGWVENDSDNTYDRQAMGVYNHNGRLLGYIPADELKEYRKWCDAKPCPCVGYIRVENGKLRGRVKVLLPCNKEFLETEFTNYMKWVEENIGSKYVPKMIPRIY